MEPYLLALEVHDMEVGKRYDMLPVHCTLVHWFRLDKDREANVSRVLSGMASEIGSVALTAESQQTFTGMTKQGPIPVTVDTVRCTPELKAFHESVCDVLDANGVNYSTPAYVRETYVPHVTHQETGSLPRNRTFDSRALYLIGADAPEYGNERTVLARFAFGEE